MQYMHKGILLLILKWICKYLIQCYPQCLFNHKQIYPCFDIEKMNYQNNTKYLCLFHNRYVEISQLIYSLNNVKMRIFFHLMVDIFANFLVLMNDNVVPQVFAYNEMKIVVQFIINVMLFFEMDMHKEMNYLIMDKQISNRMDVMIVNMFKDIIKSINNALIIVEKDTKQNN
ncbi:unnamed protein product [Paramecium primaurelia]|uniref:Secreted protein n=1 Tax=Paramecium primaurelia TaxID=5886 RepID=A0A8S1PJG1_PARPR|nr:unnamed protein product [Paramecium primaurelia]